MKPYEDYAQLFNSLRLAGLREVASFDLGGLR